MFLFGNPAENTLDVALAVDTGELLARGLGRVAPLQRRERDGAERVEDGGQSSRAFRVAETGVVFLASRMGVEQSGHGAESP